MPFEELQRVWTPTFAYEPSPVDQMYIDFYRAVREVNAALPEGERLRVWLGDPPLNPEQPVTYSPNNPPPNRDEHLAGIVSNLIDQGEKDLVIIGAYHLVPTGFPFALPGEAGGPMIIGAPPAGTAEPMPIVPGDAAAMPMIPMDQGSNVRQILDAAYPGRVFAAMQFDIIDAQADLAQYTLLILPDVLEVDAALATKIEAYVANGGRLIVSYHSGVRDGRIQLPCVGVEYVGDIAMSPDFVAPFYFASAYAI